MSTDTSSLMAPENTGLAGEFNAGFAFFLDCVVNLFVLSAILLGFGYPSEVLFNQVIPGCIAGIAIGNLMFVRMCRKIRREHGLDTVTAMPMGFDTPSTVGMSVAVYGPLFLMLKGEMGDIAAAETVWYVGMACSVWVAAFKFAASYYAHWIERIFPRSALIGSIVGISLVWLGAAAFLGTFSLPEIGIISMVILIYALVAGHRLPFNLPGAIVAILAATAVYYIMAFWGGVDGYVLPEGHDITPAFPLPQFGWMDEMFGRSLNYVSIFIPLAILVAASAVNLTVGAKMVGDPYDAKEMIQTDAAATFITALFGGVIQTTPYFGHTTYKRMGGGYLYSAGTAVVLLGGGFTGVIAFLISILPEASFRPILVVVAADIMRLSYAGIDSRYAPSIFFALMPAILNFTHVKIGELMRVVGEGAAQANIAIGKIISAPWMESYMILGTMARGYVLTGILWATAIAFIIDKRTKAAALIFVVTGVFTLFGITHSVLDSSGMYLPWALDDNSFVLRLGTSYFLAAISIFILGLSADKKGN